MPQEVRLVAPGRVELNSYQDRPPGPREVKVRLHYSAISHGTEMSHYRGHAIWHHKQVDPDGFVTEGQSMSYPFTYGYEDVAEIVAIGDEVTGFEIGQVVGCCANHRETALFSIDGMNRSTDTYFLPLPEPHDGSYERYVFVALGTVALDGVLLAPVRLGESAVVVGQGVVGLLTLQLCKLSGADPVIAVDLMDSRLQVSRELGADHVLNPKNGDVGQEVKNILGGTGADICFDASGKSGGINLALHCGTPFPRVVALGMYDGPAEDLLLGEDFCRSAGQILHSRSGGYRLAPEFPTAEGLCHRKWDFVRVNKTIISLLHRGKLQVDDLISHRFPLEKAPEAYDLIDRHPEKVTKVIFDLRFKID